MKIIGGSDPIGDIIKLHPGKKIGKYNINYNKINDTEVILHNGHIDCINQLRSNVDIVILEFFNTIRHYKLLTDDSSSFKKEIPIVNQIKVLELCNLKGVDIDYVVYDADDLKNDVSNETIKLVDARLIIENYKTKLQISNLFYKLLRLNIINFHKREQIKNITLIRSYKTGTDSFALKHYMNKYIPNELIITHPIMFENTYFPLSTNTHIEEIKNTHQSTLDFLNYFHQIEKNSIINNPNDVQADLEQYAINLNNSIEDFIIINDIDFVGIDKIFISMSFKGNYEMHITVNKWL